MPTAKKKPSIVVPAKSQKTMTIGAVMDRLRPEFPDIKVSKIRFWENEGLISPKRTDSHYRRFTEDDVQRLRYIIICQKEKFLPLRVIREQLAAMDAGTVTAIVKASDSSRTITPATFQQSEQTQLSDQELAEQAGVGLETIVRLMRLGIITPDRSGYFDADSVGIVTSCEALCEFGFDERHLKSLKNTALRQAGLIVQAAKASSLGPEKTDVVAKTEDAARQCHALVVKLLAVLMKQSLSDQFG